MRFLFAYKVKKWVDIPRVRLSVTHRFGLRWDQQLRLLGKDSPIPAMLAAQSITYRKRALERILQMLIIMRTQFFDFPS